MIRLVFMWLGSLLWLTVFSQVVRIPDPNFKQRVISLGYDTNEDNQIQVTEAQKVTSLYVNDLKIVNLEGINSFVNLEELGCYNNQLTTLDISKLKKLKRLYCNNNRIAQLNITGLTLLEHLYVQGNVFLSSLDVSKLVNLKELSISDNRIATLEVGGLNSLERIEGENNRIEKAVFAKTPKLVSVNLKNNPLTAIDIRGLAYLQYFNFEGSKLPFINFSGTISLKDYFW